MNSFFRGKKARMVFGLLIPLLMLLCLAAVFFAIFQMHSGTADTNASAFINIRMILLIIFAMLLFLSLGLFWYTSFLSTRKQLQHNEAIIQSLSENYDYLAYMDVAQDTGTSLYISPAMRPYIDDVPDGRNMSVRFDRLLQSIVLPEDDQKLREEYTYHVLISRTLTEGKIELRFRIRLNDEVLYYAMRMAKDPKQPNGIVLGMFSVDQETRREEESRRLALEARQSDAIVQRFARNSETVIVLNPGQGTYRVLGKPNPVYRTVFASANFQDAMNLYAGKFVYLPDRDQFLKEVSNENMRQILASRSEHVVHYRIMRDGTTRWMELQVTCLIEGEEVLIGFAEKDSRYLFEKLSHKLWQVYDRVYTVNLELNQAKLLKGDGTVGCVSAYSEEAQSISNTLGREARAFWQRMSHVSELREYLFETDDREYVYEVPGGDHSERHYQRAGFHVLERRHGVPLVIVITFHRLDGEQVRQQRYSQIIATLTQDYESVLHVEIASNPDQDRTTEYRLSDSFRLQLPGWSDDRRFFRQLNLIRDFFVLPEERERFNEAVNRETLLEELRKNGVAIVNCVGLRDGEQRYIQLRFQASDWNEDNEITGLLLGIRDTDAETRRNMEYSQKLHQALETAEAASKAKTAFLFNMSHDIRTPLNAVLGYTEIALKSLDQPEKLRDSLEKARHSGNILLSLINDILEMSRIESGKIILSNEKADLRKMFDNLRPMLEEPAKSKHIDLTIDCSAVKHPLIYTDLVRLERILINLSNNAIKYTPEGGTVSVLCEETDETREEKTLYRFTVKDSGIGISKEFQEHLFEEFAREDRADNRTDQGTDLGLALCKNFTELLGGTISCESEIDQGSVFTLLIPFTTCIPEPEETAVQNEDSLDETLQAVAPKTRLLLVEDNELNREIAMELLEDEGFTVEYAENGQQAVTRLAQVGSDYYQLVLMDIQMPVLDGYEAAIAIRSMFPGVDLPIVALSANAFEEDKRKSIACGMNDHVAKPIDIHELLSVITRLTKKK